MKNNFLTIYKAQLRAMLWSGRKNAKSKGKLRSRGGTATAWLVLGVILSVYEFIFMSILHKEGNTAVFLPLVALFAMFMTLMTSVSYAKLLIFEAKDHDMLFSLPLSGRTVVAAKLATMYTLDSALNFLMLVPCGIYYAFLEKPDISFYFFYFILIFFVSLIPILIAAVLSALMSLIASRFRHAQAVTVILYVIFLFAVMTLSFSTSTATAEGEKLGPVMASLVESVRAYYPPLGWFTDAILAGSLSSALLFIGVSLLAFTVVSLVFGKFYAKIHEIFRPRTVRRQYKTSEKAVGMIPALMKKDLKRIVSSTNVFMNQLMGLLMLIFFSVVFSIQSFGAPKEEIAEIYAILYPFLFAMAAAMVTDTTTSISLEGKAFPLLKSLPIPPKTILRAKLCLHMAFCSPMIIVCGVAVSLVNGLPLVGAIATVVIPLSYAYNFGMIGLLIDLKKYKFDWTSEIVIVKNSFPVMVSVLGGMALSIGSLVAALALTLIGIPLTIVLSSFILPVLILSALTTLIFNKLGEKLFLKIEC